MYSRIARRMKRSDALLITAGAGMGHDSGLPDFRGNEGLWRNYPMLRHHKLSFVEAANPQFFHSNPSQFWFFYGHRYNLYRETTPH